MSDDADFASENQDKQREIALKNHLDGVNRVSREHCVDCGLKISLARQRLINAIRCVECQHAFEMESKMYR